MYGADTCVPMEWGENQGPGNFSSDKRTDSRRINTRNGGKNNRMNRVLVIFVYAIARLTKSKKRVELFAC